MVKFTIKTLWGGGIKTVFTGFDIMVVFTAVTASLLAAAKFLRVSKTKASDTLNRLTDTR